MGKRDVKESKGKSGTRSPRSKASSEQHRKITKAPVEISRR